MAKLLLIEDDTLLARLYQKKFTKNGQEVVTAKDGEEGLSLIEKEHPDLVLLDIMMPKMSGLEMLERIKANPATRGVPVIVLTNVEDEQVEEKTLELGAITYIIKSNHDATEIVAKVQEVLAGTTRGKELPPAVSL